MICIIQGAHTDLKMSYFCFSIHEAIRKVLSLGTFDQRYYFKCY